MHSPTSVIPGCVMMDEVAWILIVSQFLLFAQFSVSLFGDRRV